MLNLTTFITKYTMATSEQLRDNPNQHKPKNERSKEDDKRIYVAMHETIAYLNDRFKEYMKGYRLSFAKDISYKDMYEQIKRRGIRKEFDSGFGERTIKPDGGVIWLEEENCLSDDKRVVLISEVKRQGTNKDRVKEGKPIQAQGNAVERLGKNLTGIKAMLNHEAITPFVCFGWGCDFVEEYTDDFVMSKISMMNEFYELNKLYVFKRDGSSEVNKYSPVSMYFREEQWEVKEMFDILKEVGEASMRYYLH